MPGETVSAPPSGEARRRIRRRWRLSFYALLLVVSHIYIAVSGRSIAPPGGVELIPQTTDAGPIDGPAQRISFRSWGTSAPTERPAFLLLHGSPGTAANFDRLGPLLAETGRAVIAPDLPGFGNSTALVRSYSLLAHAHAVRLLLDELGLDRVHIVGWSQGGGVALHVADLWPDRTASITMLASIGAQETEGSGSFHFEHAKYAFGYGVLAVGGEFLPHFGLLGTFEERHAFMRSFWDSDQRPLRPLMERLRTPTLILHGRHDFLTPAWGAEIHHDLIGPSTLVLLDASHFIPFLEAEQAAGHIGVFADAHDRPDAPALRQRVEFSVPEPSLFRSLDRAVLRARRDSPWWLLPLLPAVLAWRRPTASVGLTALLATFGWMDIGLGAFGVLLGAFARLEIASFAGAHDGMPVDAVHRARASRAALRWAFMAPFRPWESAEISRGLGASGRFGPAVRAALVIGLVLWLSLALVVGLMAAAAIRAGLGDSILAVPLAWVAAWLAAGWAVALVTWTGRRRLLAAGTRLLRHEYWNPYVLYAPLAPWIAYLAIRHRGLMTFTCANPAIEAGGGLIGESKHRIATALRPAGAAALPTQLIPPGPVERRLERLRGAMGPEGVAPGYPVILKPDAGQRGFAVRLVRSEAGAEAYFREMHRAAVVQRYDPGPHEIGCFWVRDPGSGSGRIGRVFSVTIKEFAFVRGDGAHTLEQLIYRHPRHRCQADTFLDRLGPARDLLPERGQLVRLVESGNHAQGTLFRDGAELVTPRFEEEIDRIAAAFAVESPDPGWSDNGLDFGRFDIRYRDEEQLRAGEDLGVVELNGTSSESTNLYDPSRSVIWAWGVLFRQWTALYQLGHRRRAEGVRPMTPGQLIAAWKSFQRDRPDLDIAD